MSSQDDLTKDAVAVTSSAQDNVTKPAVGVKPSTQAVSDSLRVLQRSLNGDWMVAGLGTRTNDGTKNGRYSLRLGRHDWTIEDLVRSKQLSRQKANIREKLYKRQNKASDRLFDLFKSPGDATFEAAFKDWLGAVDEILRLHRDVIGIDLMRSWGNETWPWATMRKEVKKHCRAYLEDNDKADEFEKTRDWAIEIDVSIDKMYYHARVLYPMSFHNNLWFNAPDMDGLGRGGHADVTRHLPANKVEELQEWKEKVRREKEEDEAMEAERDREEKRAAARDKRAAAKAKRESAGTNEK